MQTTWILAADASRARIFQIGPDDKTPQEIEDIAHPKGRAQNRELNTDGHGRFFGKGERYQGHTAPPHVDATQHELERFSKELGDYISKACATHRFDKLRLIAPPKLLGLMRQNLSKEAQGAVEDEIAKDISWFNTQDVLAFLQSHSKH